jgi:hypothetical protein
MSFTLQKPILLTGSTRSGTTWAAKMMGASPSIAVIHEPFHPLARIGICNIKWQHWYTYVSEEHDKSVFDALEAAFAFRYNTLKQILAIRTPRNVAGFVRDFSRFHYWRYLKHPRPLMKDPIALFSAEWLAKRFNMDVIVLIRHPAAFAWSYKRINEPNRFSSLLEQESLMNNLLSPFQREIRNIVGDQHDAIGQAILMWRINYYVVNNYRTNHPEWIFKKHEDLSLNSIEEYRDIFSRLSLDFSKSVKRTIEAFTNPSNPTEAPEGALHQLRRNSKENVSLWKKRLTPSEISRIREGTSDISKLYYSDDSWM